jgi:hypothetical protein
MPGLDKIMGMMGGGDPMGMINQLMQMVKPQQGGESGQSSQGAALNPVEMFQNIMQQQQSGG